VAPRVVSVALLGLLWAPALVPPRTAREARAIAPARLAILLAACASLGWTHRCFARFDRAMRPLDGVIAAVPPGSRVATMVYGTYPDGLRVPAFLHVGGYVLAARGGMASSGFTRTGVTYQPWVPRGALLVNQLWQPSLRGLQLDLSRYGPFYDFVLVRDGPRYRGTPFVRDHAPGLHAQRVLRDGGFELWDIRRE
jgi:hypothetical protein